MLTATVALGPPPCAAQESESGPTVYLFYSTTCVHCQAVRALVKDLQSRHPGLQAEEYDLADPENYELLIGFYQRYNVAEKQWGGTIALFMGDRWWKDGEEILAELQDAVTAMMGAAPAPAPVAAASGRARDAVIRRFEQFGAAGVGLAGLLDGVNPCAFAALVFLISYLSFARRSRGEILATGLLFAAGIFIAYLGFGIGIFRALQALSGFELAVKLLYPAMAALTLALTVYSFRDYLRARAGKVSEMTLTLPRGMLRVSHAATRRLLGSPSFLALAFVAGLVIALLELLCTGQVYLPVLMYVASTEALRARALALLIVYVTLFTLPVIAITLVAYAGVGSDRLAEFSRRHTATTKLALTIVFAALTAYLAYFCIHLFVR